MLDFELYTPTKIFFGRGRCDEVGKGVAAYGCRKPLISYGGGSARRSGLLGLSLIHIFHAAGKNALIEVKRSGIVVAAELGDRKFGQDADIAPNLTCLLYTSGLCDVAGEEVYVVDDRVTLAPPG